MKKILQNMGILCALILCLLAFSAPVLAQVSLTTLGTPATQNFDALGTTATTNVTDNTTITGVYAFRAVGNAVPNVFTADNGGSNSGRFNNYGTTAASDRAMGSASSGTPGTLNYGVRYRNNTGTTVTSLQVTYTGEQWRNGGNTTAQVLAFDYRQAATVTDLTTGTYTAVSALNFTSLQNTATAAALDGNAAANRTTLSSTITVSIPNGQEIMLRWTDINDAANDHGFGVDDLSVTPNGAVTPTVNLSVSANAGSETGATAVTVTATASSAVTGAQTVDLAVTGSGITAGDYTLSPTTITIPNGMMTGTATFTVVDDALVEGTETATITESNPSAGITLGTTTSQNVTITDNDFPAVNLSVSTNTAMETGATAVTVTATAASPVVGTQTVNFAVTGTGITLGDYSISSPPITFVGGVPNTITILNGATTGTITFTVIDDTVYEGDETATITISNPSSGIVLGTVLSQNILIVDNDTAPSFAIDSVSQAEGNAGTSNFVFTVTKTGTTALSSTVDFATSDVTATTGTDYTANSGTLTFLPNETTKTITVSVNGDTMVELDETFNVGLTNPTNSSISSGTGIGTITNDDVTPTVNLSVSTNAGSEASPAAITVTATASNPVTGAQTVDLLVSGTNITTGDYTLVPTTITILNGMTTGTATFTVVDDALTEGPETATITESNPSSGIILGTTTSQNITIADNDGLTILTAGTLPNGQINIAYTTPLTADGGVAPYTFQVTGGALPAGLTLNLNGTWSGAPTVTGPFTFDVTVTDSNPFTIENGVVKTKSLLLPNTAVKSFSLLVVPTTAASVNVGGKLTTFDGRAIKNVEVVMSDALGNVRIARSNQLGLYRFEDVPAGQNYVFSISSKRFQFDTASQVLFITEDQSDINFVALPE